MKTKQSARWTLVALLVVFTLPMLGAWFLYLHPNLLKGHTNSGLLINPPLQLSSLSLYSLQGTKLTDLKPILGKWTLLYLDSLPCEIICQQSIYNMRQIRTALGKDRSRINRMLVLVSDMPTSTQLGASLLDTINKTYVGTQIYLTGHAELHKFFKPINGGADNVKGFYLIDPIGNIMLRYPAEAPPEHIFNDLKHLLRISQIG